MASSASPVIPVVNQQQHPTNDAAAGGPPNALLSFVSNVTQTVRNILSNRRPWTELIDRSAFSKPETISDANSRIRKNYTYFRINYLTIITCALGVSLITHPFSLLLLATLLGAWLYLYLFRTSSDATLVIFGRQFSNRETLGALIISTVLVIFLTSVGYVLVSALLVGVAIVCTHAAFRAPEDLFLDEQYSPATGFLSFLTGAASNGVVASHMVSARV